MCRWPLPAQSFSGPSPLVLVTIYYCLRFETSLFVASYDLQGHGGGIRPASTRGLAGLGSSLYNLGADPKGNTASNSASVVVMGSCRAIARISFRREHVYVAVAQKHPFVYLPIA
jgi:hypothetical protein